MNKRIQQNVMIKGTKNGFMLHLDDSCSFSELLKELENKLSENYQFQENDPLISVKVHTGNRYLNEEQKTKIKQIISKKKKLVIDEVISNVLTKEEASRIHDENQVTTLARVIRSGQIIEVPGDLLLIGDVNPAATVKAGGSIYVMGQLRGIAHAGCQGNREAIIAASVMKPAMLRIDGLLSQSPDEYEKQGHDMECAFINGENEIEIDKLHVLKKYRPNLNRLEGGL
ncbi:septum site-determining protein MinC [Bacillus massiliglaciei]|uniref:septum site-determining protein MinC n=1 Tax=Bacillus massiliglaciei TaxID=1816693 RepID=UPI000AFDAAD6|nr:septum site-determining protein MinC [Bacillus massiliglaciei]